MKHPLSANQNKLFRYYKSFPNNPSLNQIFLYKITGYLDSIRLKKAIETACNSIDIFKVNFEERENEIFQNFIQNRKYEVDVFYRESNEAPEMFQMWVIEKTKGILNAPIDLRSWPLIRFALYLFQPDENYLSLCAPHVILDGLSYTHLIHKINQSYKLRLNELERETIQDLTSLPALKDLKFFTHGLLSLDSFVLKPIEQKRNLSRMLDGTIHHLEISKPPLEQFLYRHKYSASSFFLAIHALFLKKTRDGIRVTIGLPALNRNKSNRNSFECFINPSHLDIDFGEIQTFPQLIATINKKILRLLRHQLFDVNRADHIDSIFTNYFTYYDREFNYSIGNCSFERIYLKKNAVGSELRLTVEDRGENWKLCIESGEFFKFIDVPTILQVMIDQAVAGNLLQAVGGGMRVRKSSADVVNRATCSTEKTLNANVRSQNWGRYKRVVV